MAKAEVSYSGGLSGLLRDHKTLRDKDVEDLELDEQELWDLDDQNSGSYHLQHHKVHHYNTKISRDSSTYSSKINIPQHQQQQGKVLHRQQSAPMNVPDWSKILGSSANSKHSGNEFFDYDDDEEDSYEQRIPPHEVVARDYTRSHVMTFSVRETLKGRDVSRVRNAVLKQTGFL